MRRVRRRMIDQDEVDGMRLEGYSKENEMYNEMSDLWFHQTMSL